MRFFRRAAITAVLCASAGAIAGGAFGPGVSSIPDEITIDGGDTRWVNAAGDTMTGALQCNAGAYVVGTLSVDGGVGVTGAVTVTGATNANGGIVAQAGNLTVASPDGGVLIGPNRTAITGTASVTGAIDLQAAISNTTAANGGAVYVADAFTATGAVTLQSALTQSGGIVNLYNGNGDNAYTIIGSDSVGYGRTNVTNKQGRIMGVHYTNAEEPVMVIGYDSTATTNSVKFGGGTYIGNTATSVDFYTAATSTTTTGTKRLGIDSDGFIDIVGTPSSGTCTLNAQTPAFCTVATTDGAHCTCSPVGLTAAIAAAGCAVSLTETTLTITGADGASTVMNYHCF